MRAKTFLFVFVFLVAGCAFHSKPENNLEFKEIADLQELAGVYKNKGNPSGFLSQKIWSDITRVFPDIRNVKTLDTGHENIEFIEVISVKNSLIVKAITDGCAVYEEKYTLGEDFKISDGKIVIKRESHLLSRGAGDVLLGPSYEDIAIGIDAGKHGKSRSTGYAAGLVFMIIPVAISDSTEIRYERVHNKPQYFKACGSRKPLSANASGDTPFRPT